jgi:hypothetical protein
MNEDVNHWLAQDAISIKRLINIARRAELTAWDDFDALWAARVTALYDAVMRGDLPAASENRFRWYTIRLVDLWSFCRKRSGDWEWCCEFCRQWSSVNGITIEPITNGTAGGESKCRQWLDKLVQSGPPDRNRRDYRTLAIHNFGVSGKGFDRAWATATAGHRPWTKPGPKNK